MINFRINILAAFLIMTISITAEAMQIRKHGDAVITLQKDGIPCFSYPQDEEILKKKSFSFGYMAIDNYSPHEAVWEVGIVHQDGKGLLEPNSVQNCIRYGRLNSGMKHIRKPTKTFSFDTPYNVLIRVSASYEEHGTVRRYNTNFCVSHDAHGNPILVNAAWDHEETHAMKCLKPGELPKGMSIWKRVFGK